MTIDCHGQKNRVFLGRDSISRPKARLQRVIHTPKAYDVRMYLIYPGTFLVPAVMHQNFVNTVGLKCKLDLALCHIAWDCPTKLDT